MTDPTPPPPHTSSTKPQRRIGVVTTSRADYSHLFWPLRELAAHPDSHAAQVVRAGIEDSASFGMARQAGLGGVPIAGKTGTAEGAASNQSHGWFAGVAPADKPQVVVVVYLPAGRGADAAHVAAELLSHSSLVHQ